MDETLDQIKEKNIIDLLFVAINDLARYQSSPVVIANTNNILNGLVKEYNEKYPGQKDYTVPEEKK